MTTSINHTLNDNENKDRGALPHTPKAHQRADLTGQIAYVYVKMLEVCSEKDVPEDLCTGQNI